MSVETTKNLAALVSFQNVFICLCIYVNLCSIYLQDKESTLHGNDRPFLVTWFTRTHPPTVGWNIFLLLHPSMCEAYCR